MRKSSERILQRISEDCSALAEMAKAAHKPFLAYLLSVVATEAARGNVEPGGPQPSRGTPLSALPYTATKN